MLTQPQYHLDAILSDLKALFFAGHDTTSHTMSFLVYLLCKFPKKKQKLQKEIDRAFLLKENGPWSTESISELKYLTACIKETLRIFPIAWAQGVNTATQTKVRGYTIPAGIECVLFTLHFQNSPEFYPEPQKFRPERWLSGHKHSTKMQLFAFSLGTHSCLGKNLAYLECKIVIATLFHRFDFKLFDESQELKIGTTVTIYPLNDIRVVPIQRT